VALEDQPALDGQEIQHHPFVQAPLVVLSHQADHQYPVILKVIQIQNWFTQCSDENYAFLHI